MNLFLPRIIIPHVLIIMLLVLFLNGCSGSDDTSQLQKADIQGNVNYEDREYGMYGFNGKTSFKAVRFAVVDLVDNHDQIIDTTVTDEKGYYQLAGSGYKLRVRVLAQTDSSMGSEITIADYDGSTYATNYPLEAETTEGKLDISITLESSIVGAYNILDVLTNATLFVSQFSSQPLPPLQTVWRNKSSRYGTYFCTTERITNSCPHGGGIYLLGGSSSGGDTDHFDDDVIYHEYAHYMESALGISDSPGGVHYLTENDQDIRLSFSEGLGGFIPAAVKTWLFENDKELLSLAEGVPPTYFVDTYGSIAGISIDIADPNRLFCSGGKDCFIYSTSEISVAKILTGVMKTFGMQGIWDTMSSYMSSGTTLPSSLETFWDGWLAQRAPGNPELALLTSILNDRKVFYQHDSYESDNVVGLLRKASVCETATCGGERHFLYHGDLDSDKDLIAFDAHSGSTYVVETFELSNGADTYIRILDSSGVLVYNSSGQPLVNDDRPGTVYCGRYDNPCRVHNDATMLSSQLYFVPQTSGTYYVEVSTSPSKSLAAGRYGTYSLQILN